jgi:hypothetical protein
VYERPPETSAQNREWTRPSINGDKIRHSQNVRPFLELLDRTSFLARSAALPSGISAEFGTVAATDASDGHLGHVQTIGDGSLASRNREANPRPVQREPTTWFWRKSRLPAGRNRDLAGDTGIGTMADQRVSATTRRSNSSSIRRASIAHNRAGISTSASAKHTGIRAPRGAGPPSDRRAVLLEKEPRIASRSRPQGAQFWAHSGARAGRLSRTLLLGLAPRAGLEPATLRLTGGKGNVSRRLQPIV